MIVILQIKNILVIISLAFLIIAYINFSSGLDTQERAISPYYYDYYQFAKDQRSTIRLDILSFFLISLYLLKYLQLIKSIQLIFIAFKKSAFEYFALTVTISVLFIGLSILTSFVFGSYIYEYKNFADSITTNIKIFIFIENTSITNEFLKYYRVFSIIVLIVFIFLIRYFLLNLYYPIFIEYYRIEHDKLYLSKKHSINTGDSIELSSKQSKTDFIFRVYDVFVAF